MDIQRQAFEKEYNKHHPNDMATRLQNGNYSGWVKQASWEMWQQAQKVAVPEGFVLMPIQPTEEMIKKATYEFNDLDIDDIDDRIVFSHQAMIEAQEHHNGN